MLFLPGSLALGVGDLSRCVFRIASGVIFRDDGGIIDFRFRVRVRIGFGKSNLADSLQTVHYKPRCRAIVAEKANRLGWKRVYQRPHSRLTLRTAAMKL